MAAQMAGAELYYNDLIAVERRRRTAVTRYWADVGGYTAQLDALDAARLRARAIHDKATRKAAWADVDAMTAELRALEKSTIAGATTDPATVRRKARTAELRARAKAAGDKLTPADIARVLDADPECVTARDRIRIDMIAAAEARGKQLSAVLLNKAYRDAGLCRTTDHIDDKAKAEDLAAYRARRINPHVRSVVTEAVERAIADRMPGVPLFAQAHMKPVVIGVGYVVADEVTVADLFACTDTRAQIVRSDDSAKSTPGSRRHGRRATLRLRVGSDASKRPVWAEFPIQLDAREMPMDARVSTVRVTRERIGCQYRWSAHVCVVEKAARCLTNRDTNRENRDAVAIDLGWRAMHDGSIRCATWVGEDGATGHLGCDTGTIGRIEKTNEIKGLLSELLEAITKKLGEWDYAATHDPADPVAVHLAARLRGVSRCRGPRLARLVSWWESAAVAPGPGVPAYMSASRACLRTDEAMAYYRAIAAWHERYRHLTPWVAHGDEGARAHRDDQYRVAMSRLCARYSTVLVRGHSISEIKRRKLAHETERSVELDDKRRSQMFFGAPGYVRELVLGMPVSRGREVVAVEHAVLPTRCHACGVVCQWDREWELRHACEHCGAEWDQDLNTARNMLDLYRERFGDGDYDVGVRGDRKSRKGKDKCVAPRLSAIQNDRELAEKD